MQYRLKNGTSPDNGRLEVAYDGVWGTVCANGFDDKEAAVICRKLGFRYGMEYTYTYTMACPPVGGDNPRALARGLSPLQVDNACFCFILI